MIKNPFMPTDAATVNIDVSSSSQSVSLASGVGPLNVRVMNNGTATVWIKFGATGLSATLAAGVPIGPGVTEVLTAPACGTTIYAAAIAAGSTGKIYFTPGIGI